MSKNANPVAVARGRLASAHRYGYDADTIARLERELTTAKLTRSIREALDAKAAPTPEQCVKAAQLLMIGGAK